MKVLAFVFLLLGTYLPGAWSQETPATVADTSIKQNPIQNAVVQDSFPVSKRPDNIGKKDTLMKFPPDSAVSLYGISTGGYLVKHPWFRVSGKATMTVSLKRDPPDTDWIFYLFSGLLFYLALLKLLFPKYFADLFRVFFNTAMRQKQIREQLIQEPLPALLLNVFFIFSASVFAYFLLRYYRIIGSGDNKWLILGISTLTLTLIYVVKFIFIRFMGWILARRDEAETYNFVVFMVNKFIGFFLLPAALMLAVTHDGWAKTVVLLCYVFIAGLLIYRWVRAFQLVHKGLRINQLHLLIFVVSFEVIPVLVLYKVLFNLFD